MLIGLGFKPLAAAGLSLIGNTAPVAFGALGTPVITLAAVTGLPVEKLSAMVGRQLPFFSVIVPFWLVWAMAGFAGMAEVWPACLTAGVFFAIPQFIVSNTMGPALVDIIARHGQHRSPCTSCFVSGSRRRPGGSSARGRPRGLRPRRLPSSRRRLEGLGAVANPLGLGVRLGLQGHQGCAERGPWRRACVEDARTSTTWC